MLKKPLIIGGLGNMGRRYTAILREMGIEPRIEDIGVVPENDFDSIIVASPTESHTTILNCVLAYGVPILCEKPISKSIEEISDLCGIAEGVGTKLEMVNQYKYCLSSEENGTNETHYNYFQTGKDGLAWDCTSIIALAEGAVSIKNNSPVWTCVINGRRLNREGMDQAYVDMIDAWLHGELVDCGTDYIRRAHAKVHAYIEANP